MAPAAAGLAARGGLLWAVAYALLGVVSGGIFDSPLLAILLATLLVLLVGAVVNLVSARRRRAAAHRRRSRPTLGTLRVVMTRLRTAAGRMLRTGRTLARVVVTWAAVTWR